MPARLQVCATGFGCRYSRAWWLSPSRSSCPSMAAPFQACPLLAPLSRQVVPIYHPPPLSTHTHTPPTPGHRSIHPTLHSTRAWSHTHTHAPCVTCTGSELLWWAARSESKPGVSSHGTAECWVLVSTARCATALGPAPVAASGQARSRACAVCCACASWRRARTSARARRVCHAALPRIMDPTTAPPASACHILLFLHSATARLVLCHQARVTIKRE